MKNYHINIFYSDADKGYIADIPDLEACSAFGKTPTDALKQAQLGQESLAGSGSRNRQTHPQTALPTCHLPSWIVRYSSFHCCLDVGQRMGRERPGALRARRGWNGA